MAKAGYAIGTEGAVSLTGGAAKSVLGVLAPAQFGCDLIGFDIAFDGITATSVPVLIELCTCSFATNAPGTNSTSVTVDQTYGRAVTAGFTAAKNWTTEPTTVAAIREFLLTPNGGVLIYEFPLGQTPDNDVSKGFVLRLNAPASVGCRGSMRFERC